MNGRMCGVLLYGVLFRCFALVCDQLIIMRLFLFTWMAAMLSIVVSFSEFQCKNLKKNATVMAGCDEQKRKQEVFHPLNSSIYYVSNDKMLDKKYHTFFKLSFFDPHRDGRFYKDLSVPSAKRHHLLINTYRAFADFAKENNLKFWLVHGGLIGWFWNEQLLPWDMDLDIMVLYYDLKYDYSKFDKSVYRDRYLFEINPNSVYREHQLSDVIDARFIDKLSGLYVDITAASYDPKRNQVHCKSPHYYNLTDIFPLRSGNFSHASGTTWLPNNPAAMLTADFGARCMTRKKFERGKRLFDHKYGGTNYKFDEEKHLWVLDDELNKRLRG